MATREVALIIFGVGLWAMVFGGCGPAAHGLAPPLSTRDEVNTIEVFRAAAPGAVFVSQNRLVRDWYTMRALEVPGGSGTGFVWDSDGHIVTNYHVIDGATSLMVTLINQKSYEATLVGGEPRKDIAVLHIDAPVGELLPVVLHATDASLVVGQKAIAIGNPFGLDHTLTTGVVSALGREVPGYGGVSIRDMIQTDASINPGNSGGPLLDSAGRLIGMNTQIFSQTGTSSGIGFAVPASTIRRLVPQLIEHGYAKEVGIGVTILPDEVARRAGIEGVIVRSVAEGSPAEREGIRGLSHTSEGIELGDIIVRIDEREITGYDDLYNALDGRSAGERVRVGLVREAGDLEVDVELIEIR